MSANPDYLIVYGTLRPAFDNDFAKYLRQRATCVGNGTFAGLLIDLGSYPGAVYKASSPTSVCGTVYHMSTNKETILTYLDFYEGVGVEFEQPTEYIRTVVPVLADGTMIDCWVYVYNQQTDQKPLILSGDYVQHLNYSEQK